MAAFFHNSNGDGIFKNSVGMGEIAISDAFDQLNDGSTGTLAIITDVAISARETVQFFQSFDDLISFYFFGKGLGAISLNLMFFLDCSGKSPGSSAPGLDRLMTLLGSIRGTLTDFSVGSVTFSGVVTDFTVQVASEPETHYLVNINLGMTDHTLEQVNFPSPGC